MSGEQPAVHRAAGSTVVRRAWAGFRRWRRTRPFWGGMLLVLSALEMYSSAHQDLTPIKVSFGPQVFMSWVIPLGLLLCGLLAWFTPAQRMFYGLLGAMIAVVSLIGLNFGGFFIGMLLGLVGGALAFSWTPGTDPRATATAESPATAELDGVGPAPGDPDTVVLDDGLDGVLDGSRDAGREVGSAGDPGESPPPTGTNGRHHPPTSRMLGLILLVAMLTAGLLTFPRPMPALAAPCPTSTGSSGTVPPASAGPPAPSATPSASTSTESNPVARFFDGLGKLLGIGGNASTPTPTPTPAPASTAKAVAAAPPRVAAAAPNCATSPTPKRGPSRSASPSPNPGTSGAAGSGTAKAAALPAGQPLVNKQPSTQLSGKLSEMLIFFDGVVNVPVKGGTIRALQFHLDSATSVPFELDIPVGNGLGYTIKSTRLKVSGHVVLFATEIKGRAGLLGLDILPVDYTPDSPPPLTPPIVEFADATVKLVFIRADTLTAANLHISG